MNLSGIRDVNELKRLLAMGAISQDQLNNSNISGSFGPDDNQQVPQNALQNLVSPQDMQAPQQMQQQPQQMPQQQPPEGSNFVRNEQTGHVTYLTPQGLSDRPSMGAVIQPQQQQAPRMMKVIGAGGGTRVDLSPEQAPDKVNLDYSRSPYELMGGARASYSKDEPGTAYVMGPDGRPSAKIILGYDMQGSMALNKANADLAHTQAETQHTQEQIRASQVNNPDLTGAAGSGVNMSLTGNDFLKQLDPGIANEVKALGDGKTPFNPRSQRQLNLLAMVQQYNPDWSATDYQGKQATTKDFATGGKSGQVVQAINQALHHASTVSDAIDALNNSNTLPGIVNPIVNTVEQKLGGDVRQGNFATAANALSEELKKIYAGGGGSLAELQNWQKSFDPNAGQNQQKSYLAQGMNLLQGAIESRAQAYQRGMGPSADFGKLFTPQAMDALQKLQSKGYIGGAQTPQTSQAQPSQSIPPQAISFLKSNPASRYDFDRKYGQGASAQVLGNG